jgi:GT2 family glycosyltransferase
MGFLKNRIRTIAGEESGFWQATGSLLYYFASPQRYMKLFGKLWKRMAIKIPDYNKWLAAQQYLDVKEKTGIHFTIVCAPTEVFQQRYSNVTFVSPEQAASIPPDSYVLWLDKDDRLNENTCAMLAQNIHATRAKIVTVDFDMLKDGKRGEPHFQPSWSPVTLAYSNYIQNAVCIQARLIQHPSEAFLGATGFYTMLKQIDVPLNQTSRVPQVLLTKATCMLATEPIAVPLQKPLVSIVIPTYNKAHLVKQCIDSIVNRSSYARYEIVLVDNNSVEQALAELIEAYHTRLGKAFVHVRAEYDFNFSQLMNDGVKNSKGAYVVLLNNDTEVITPDWIEQLLAIAVRDDVGAVGAKLLYPDNTIQHAGIELSSELMSRHVFVGSMRSASVYQNALNTIRQYSAVTAACLMVNKEKYNEVGGFDSRYKVEFNDIDFCLRLLSKGYYNVYSPHAQIYHYESASRRHPMASKKSKHVYLHERELMRQQWSRYISDDPYGHPNINLFRL